MEKEKLALIEANQKVLNLPQNLLITPAIVARGVSVPKERGICLWRSKDGEMVYIGVGNGEKGLSGSINGNHLSPGYSKSFFRIKVARELGLDIGRECVEFILENFRIAFLPNPDKHFSEAAEKLLIAVFRPKYNA
jgi:hypothetical protein